VNNLNFCSSGSQDIVKDLILATTATEVSTAPWIGLIDDGASFMWPSASFASATASSMFNPAASGVFDVAAIVNSMMICVLH